MKPKLTSNWGEEYADEDGEGCGNVGVHLVVSFAAQVLDDLWFRLLGHGDVLAELQETVIDVVCRHYLFTIASNLAESTRKEQSLASQINGRGAAVGKSAP